MDIMLVDGQLAADGFKFYIRRLARCADKDHIGPAAPTGAIDLDGKPEFV